ncbi:MAG: biopolymer transporter ExbD [Verrucomicrobiota bacterium]|jgi:biopolymer transport protein ExbD
MRLPRNAKIFRGQLDVAPFAGVFFLLVIFLLLQSSFVFTPGVHVSLPDVSEHLPGTDKPTVVATIDASGRIYFESQVIHEESLLAKLKSRVKENRDLTLVIQADKEGKLEPTLRLMALARKAGIQETVVATQPEDFLSSTNQAKPK